MRILLIVLLGYVLARAFRTAKGKSVRRSAEGPAAPDPTVPDRPQPFGYKNSWLCIRADTPQEVMEGLELTRPEPCNWAAGLARAGGDGGVFVSPCLDGWVLVVGVMDWSAEYLARRAAQFPEMQYFYTHRVVEYHSWAKYLDGRLFRGYTYCGESGEVLWDEGDLTPEELNLGAADFPRGGQEIDWDFVHCPDEQTVLDLAAAWGVDTGFAGAQYPAALGWLCKAGEGDCDERG